MNSQQAQKMLDFLESFVTLALVPMNPDMYDPEEECELDMDKVFSLSLTEGDEWLDEEGEFEKWVRCTITVPSHWETQQHYKRLREAVKALDGIEVISYRLPRYDSDESPYLLLGLTDHDHLREIF